MPARQNADDAGARVSKQWRNTDQIKEIRVAIEPRHGREHAGGSQRRAEVGEIQRDCAAACLLGHRQLLASLEALEKRKGCSNAGQQHEYFRCIRETEIARGPVFEPIARHVVDKDRGQRDAAQPVDPVVAQFWKCAHEITPVLIHSGRCRAKARRTVQSLCVSTGEAKTRTRLSRSNGHPTKFRRALDHTPVNLTRLHQAKPVTSAFVAEAVVHHVCSWLRIYDDPTA